MVPRLRIAPASILYESTVSAEACPPSARIGEHCMSFGLPVPQRARGFPYLRQILILQLLRRLRYESVDKMDKNANALRVRVSVSVTRALVVAAKPEPNDLTAAGAKSYRAAAAIGHWPMHSWSATNLADGGIGNSYIRD